MFVVYGRRSQGTVDLNALGTGGFRVDGAAAGDFFGEYVASIGDMTGDGLSEVVVSAPFASPQGRTGAGAAYVIFGAPSSGGFRYRRSPPTASRSTVRRRQASQERWPEEMLNGDGRADVVILSGSSTYVVFRRPRGSGRNG